MAAERLLQHGEPAGLGRKAFDGADRWRRRPAPRASGRRAPARRRSGPCRRRRRRARSRHACRSAPSLWRRKSVSSMRGSASASYRAAIELRNGRGGAHRRSGAASTRLLDGGAAELAHEHCGDSRRSRADRPARRAPRRMRRARHRARAVEIGKVADDRAVGNAADREPHVRLRAPRPRRPRSRNRRGGARIRGTRSHARRCGTGTRRASINSSSLRAVDIMPGEEINRRNAPPLLPSTTDAMAPLSASRTSGNSALGSACATEPQTVPRLRVCACPTHGNAAARSGWRSASSGHARSSACRTPAPTRMAFASTAIFASSAQMHDVDQRLSGAPCASTASARRLCPPARMRASLAFGGKRGMRLRQRPGAQIVEAGGLQDRPRARLGACSAG